MPSTGTNILIGGAVIGGGVLIFRRLKQRAIQKALVEAGTDAVKVLVTKGGELLVGATELVSATADQIKAAADALGITSFFVFAEPEADPEDVAEFQAEFDALNLTVPVPASPDPAATVEPEFQAAPEVSPFV